MNKEGAQLAFKPSFIADMIECFEATQKEEKIDDGLVKWDSILKRYRAIAVDFHEEKRNTLKRIKELLHLAITIEDPTKDPQLIKHVEKLQKKIENYLYREEGDD